MNSVRAEEILKEIGREGSDLHTRYIQWINNPDTELIMDLMFHLSTPDKVVENTEIMEGCDKASMLLGISVGRSRSVEMMQTLHFLTVTPNEDLIEDFGAGSENEKETEGES